MDGTTRARYVPRAESRKPANREDVMGRNATWLSILGALAVVGVGATGLLGTVGAQTAGDREAIRQDQRDVRAAHHRLMNAYGSMDAGEILNLLADAESVHLFHPRGNLDFEGKDTIKWGLQRMWERVGPAAWLDEAHNRVVVEGNVAWHTYYMSMRWEERDESIDARGTEIWVRRDGGWRLMHAHWSENQADDPPRTRPEID